MKPNVVDSSAWLEYFSNGANAKHFARPIENTKLLIVPVICLYEVFRKILHERGENEALQVAALMGQGEIVEIGSELALLAAKISVEEKIPMADSLIYAVAVDRKAMLWTQDADLKNFPNVKFFPKN